VQDAIGTTLFTEASGGGFWVMDSRTSEIRRRSSKGDLEYSFEIQRDWFDGSTEFIPGEGISIPSRPINLSVSELSSDRLLVSTWVAEQEWEPISTTGRFSPKAIVHSDSWDTVLEVVDSPSGTVLASLRVDQALTLVRGTEDQFYSVREENDGHISVDIWKAEPTSKGGQGFQ
jgi:hypothetical protein